MKEDEILKIYEKLKKNHFAQKVMVLTSGTVLAQVINTLLSPIITRLYSPSDYGVLTVFTAILGMISLIGSLAYENAIPIAEDDEKAINILALSGLILAIITIFLTTILMVWGEAILRILDSDIIVNYKYFIPIGFFTTGLYSITMNWAYRKKDYSSITKTKYRQSIFSNLFKIGYGIIISNPIGLIIGRIIGQSAGITSLSSTLRNNDSYLFKKVQISSMIWVLKRYIKFMKYSAPSTFLVSFSSRIPVVFITSLFGLEAAGYYGLALNISFIPMTFIGKSVQDVFFVESAKIAKDNPKKVKSLSRKLLITLMLIGFVPISVIVIGGTFIFPIVFGPEWYEAGIYARLISIYVYSHFIFHPISSIFNLYEKQQNSFYMNIFKIVGVVFSFTVAKFLELSSYQTVLLFSVIMASSEFAKYFLAQSVINKQINIKERLGGE